MTELERKVMALGLDGKAPGTAAPAVLRAARAIVEAEGIEDAMGRPHTFDTVSHHYREQALNHAAAVIISLRQPTEAMKWAGTEKACDYHGAEEVWEAMIDAALLETPKPAAEKEAEG